MQTLKNHLLSFPLLIATCTLLLVNTACDSGAGDRSTPPAEETGSTMTTATPVQQQFYHSWLAYSTSGETVSDNGNGRAMGKLTQLGKSRIENALADTTLQKVYYPQAQYPLGVELAWGPVLTVEYLDSFDLGLTNNLMYVLEAQRGDTTELSIGIAGTNMISSYDWFVEDFEVAPQNQKPWSDSSGTERGKISQGTAIGLRTLLNMVDSSRADFPDLVAFLRGRIAQGATPVFKISVTGHSLGGALAPTLALSLKQSLASESVVVEAWPFAGPTPGNSAFADYLLATLDHFEAHNNALDVVPHVWQADSLNQLCNIYDELGMCDDYGAIVTDGSPVLGVLRYFREVAAGGDYHVIGTPKNFRSDYSIFSDVEACGGFLAAVAGVVEFQEPEDLVKGLVDLIHTCHLPFVQDTTLEKLEEGIQFLLFLSYMAELGGQHTTAYFDHFVPDTKIQQRLNRYITGAQTGIDTFLEIFVNGSIGLPILETLLFKANAKLQASGISDCNCST
ncbi:MAG: hypothetical protein AAFW73_10165 [Bacteroidota bacterium]